MVDAPTVEGRARTRGRVVQAMLAATALLLSSSPRSASAQTGHAHSGHERAADSTAADRKIEETAHGAMARTVTAGAHVRLTPNRRATAVDEAKARQVLDELRSGIERYHDYRVALDEGFRIFAPEVEQRVYHFTNYRRALREHRRFEPAEPSSLLYEKSGDGYRLVGAMLTARRDATPEELDARVPLGVARWHAHVDICVPRWRERARWHEVHDGKPVFGPAGTIATRADCEAAGGRFLDQVFGWMVHVNVLEREPHRIWGNQEQHGHAH